jgi:hypothetical protein
MDRGAGFQFPPYLVAGVRVTLRSFSARRSIHVDLAVGRCGGAMPIHWSNRIAAIGEPPSYLPQKGKE